MNEEIRRLTRKWYELVNYDHHKDRDCHFYINEVWSYGAAPIWRAEHYGYVGQEFSVDCATYEEAQKELVSRLKDMFKEEVRWANGVLATKENWDKDQIEHAEKIIKLALPLP